MRLPTSSYRSILITMTSYQFMYDLFLALYFCDEDNLSCENIRGFAVVATGIATALWSNVMVFTVLHVIVKKKIFDFHKYFIVFSLLIITISCVNGYTFMFIANAQNTSYEIYNSLRLASILFNIGAFVFIKIKLHSMKFHTTEESINRPIIILCDRLALYPLIQAISRIGPLWYNLQTGNTLSDFKHVSHPPPIHIAAALCSAITSPSAGLGYFILFLYLQKGAFPLFLSWIGHIWSRCCCCWCCCVHGHLSSPNSPSDTTTISKNLQLSTSPSIPASGASLETSDGISDITSNTFGYRVDFMSGSKEVSSDSIENPLNNINFSTWSVDQSNVSYEQMDEDLLIETIRKL